MKILTVTLIAGIMLEQSGVSVAAYQKVFDSLARPNDDVEVARGCMISREPFRQLLSEVQDGRFDDYLSRPPW